MLVLSRKQNDQILLPNLGVRVEILRIAGNSVRVGIQAPQSVRVLRGELADGNAHTLSPSTWPAAERGLSHMLRNQLN